ncbi:hypothetical protein OGAPHI_006681 [Ogataea philodendri]|uniref:Ubiquitin-like domain-containing protein n=1 Tax=Ogataea philodendri TaxID=1378263 RepID=A0A9P8NYA2_9ASCO|nr:uncharacterized protein OGAPHI_006681 [Ogataea philodendri]KAH3661274.1 hypothetical protein OGAPHI_006681 [Ogataea philodendri]
MSVASEVEFANKFQDLVNFVCPERINREINYQSVKSTSTTVYKLKEQLAAKIGADVDQITLMVKTKTIHDEDLVGKHAVDGELKLNAMVKAKAKPVAEPVTEPATSVPVTTLSSAAWSRISDVLASEIKDETTRNEYLQKLKKVRI